MQTTLVLVRAHWDEDAQVWVATSEEMPGLVTEAATLEELRAKIAVMVPELMEANGITSDLDQIAIHLLAEQTTRIPNPTAGARR